MGCNLDYQIIIETSHTSDLKHVYLSLKSILKEKKKMDIECLLIKPINNRNWKKFLVNCQDSYIKEAIIQKKIFGYNSCLFRSSENGYQKDLYDLNNFQLILSNIDKEFVKLYAENLQNGNDSNEVDVDVTPLLLLDSTYLVSFSMPYDKDEILTRLKKRPMLRNKRIELLDCFQTNSIIAMPKIIKESDSLLTELELIKNKILENIAILKIKENYFYEILSRCVIFQFDFVGVEMNTTRLIESMKNETLFIVEYCYNFSLVDKINTDFNIPVIDSSQMSNFPGLTSEFNNTSENRSFYEKKEIHLQENSVFLNRFRLDDFLLKLVTIGDFKLRNKKKIILTLFFIIISIFYKNQHNPDSIKTEEPTKSSINIKNYASNFCADPYEKFNHRTAFSSLVKEGIELASRSIILDQLYCSSLNEIISYKKSSKCPITIIDNESDTLLAGYKLLFESNSCHDRYIRGRFSFNGIKNNIEVVYNDNKGNAFIYKSTHWEFIAIDPKSNTST